MAGTSSQPEFDFDDFRRYHHGEMSEQEQHYLEKRMLEDTFVAEAYEGFLALNEDQIKYQPAIENLRQTLTNRIEPKRNNVMLLWSYASAACIVLGLGIYWLVTGLNKNTGREDVAFEMAIDKPGETTEAREPELKETPSPPLTALKPLPQKAPASAPAVTAEREPSESIEPVKEEEKLLDTDLDEAIAANEQQQISIVETIPASAPAAALSAQTPRKSAAKVSGSNAAAGNTTSLSSRPAPLMGWVSYQSYLFKNSASTEGPGEVDVSFMVNADSTLSEFLTKGDERFFQKAIRTIQNGPAWIPAKSDGQQIGMPITIRIQFRKSK